MRRDLVEAAQRGDRDAFAALATADASRLDAAARLILRDPEQARDAVQEALIRAWRDLRGLRDPDRFEPWLHRLLVRACLDEARRRRRHAIEVELEPVHADRLGGDDTPERHFILRDELERGFRRLDPEARAAIVLHYYLDLPVPDTAAALGVPLGTAKSRIHRAVEQLRAALDAEARVLRPPEVGRA